MDEFIVSTEDLNSHGYRILTKGIQLGNFRKNPVMLYGHSWGSVPIGKWVNLRKEDGKLIATPEFNEKDPFALQIKEAVEGGFVNATSIGATPVNFSDDPKYLVEGQKGYTLTKCDLFEISFVDLPSNPYAVRLSATEEKFKVPLLKQEKVKNMSKNIALSLGLGPEATEAEILAAVKASKDQQNAQNLDALIALGRANGHINDGNVDIYRNAAKADYSNTLSKVKEKKEVVAPASSVEEAPVPITLAAVMEEVKKGNSTEAPKTESKAEQFVRLSKTDPDTLGKISRENPTEFAEMQKAYTLSLKK